MSDNLRADVLAFMAVNPQASVRDVAAQAPISKLSVWQMLNNSDLHPYHLNLHQSLRKKDLQDPLYFSNWIITKCDKSLNFFSNVIWTDEASFCRNAQVNLHNAHYWSGCSEPGESTLGTSTSGLLMVGAEFSPEMELAPSVPMTCRLDSVMWMKSLKERWIDFSVKFLCQVLHFCGY